MLGLFREVDKLKLKEQEKTAKYRKRVALSTVGIAMAVIVLYIGLSLFLHIPLVSLAALLTLTLCVAKVMYLGMNMAMSVSNLIDSMTFLNSKLPERARGPIHKILAALGIALLVTAVVLVMGAFLQLAPILKVVVGLFSLYCLVSDVGNTYPQAMTAYNGVVAVIFFFNQSQKAQEKVEDPSFQSLLTEKVKDVLYPFKIVEEKTSDTVREGALGRRASMSWLFGSEKAPEPVSWAEWLGLSSTSGQA